MALYYSTERRRRSSFLPGEMGGVPEELMKEMLGLSRRRRRLSSDPSPTDYVPGRVPEELTPKPVVVQPLPRIRPVVTPPVVAPTLEVAPAVPVIDVGEQPLTRIRNGRPEVYPGMGSNPDALRQRRRALEAYEPKDMDWKQIGLRALGGFIQGGIPGAVGTTAMSLLDRDAPDEHWKARELAATDEQLQRVRSSQRMDLQDELLTAQVADERAQAEQRRRPPRPIYVQEMLEDGTKISTPIDPITREPVGEPRVVGQPRPRTRVSTPQGELEVSPEAALGYYGALSREEREGVKRQGEQASVATLLTESEAAEKDALAGRAAASTQLSTLRRQMAALDPKSPNYWNDRDAIEGQIKDAEAEVARRQAVAERAAEDARKARAELKKFSVTPSTRQPRVVMPKSDPLGLFK